MMRLLILLALLLAGPAFAQTAVVPGYQTPQNPGLQFSPVGGPSSVTGWGQLSVTSSSTLMSGLSTGQKSGAWPNYPGMVYISNSPASAGILYVAPLGGTCSSTTDIPIAVGGSYGFLHPSSSLTVCAASTATAVAQW